MKIKFRDGKILKYLIRPSLSEISHPTLEFLKAMSVHVAQRARMRLLTCKMSEHFTAMQACGAFCEPIDATLSNNQVSRHQKTATTSIGRRLSKMPATLSTSRRCFAPVIPSGLGTSRRKRNPPWSTRLSKCSSTMLCKRSKLMTSMLDRNFLNQQC